MVGNIVSKDAKARPSSSIRGATAREQAIQQAPLVGDGGADRQGAASPGIGIYQLGRPLIDATVGDFIMKDVMTFVPLSLGVLFALLLLSFRTLQGMVIPFVTGVLSIVWALGLMALFGLPINVLTASIPSLILVIGATEDVHMLSEYHLLLREGVAKLAAIRTTIERAALPILITTATTVFGFASLVTSDLTMLIQFGYASALALTANFVVTVLALPIMLRMWRVPKRFAPPRPGGRARRHLHTADRSPRRVQPAASRLHCRRLGAAGRGVTGWVVQPARQHRAARFFPEQSFIRVRSSDLCASR